MKYLVQRLPPGRPREDGWIVLDIVGDPEKAAQAARRVQATYPNDEVRVLPSDRYR